MGADLCVRSEEGDGEAAGGWKGGVTQFSRDVIEHDSNTKNCKTAKPPMREQQQDLWRNGYPPGVDSEFQSIA